MTVDGRVTVFVLAQKRLLREALSKNLCKREPFLVVGSCALTHDSMREILSVSPEVLLMDYSSTNVSQLEFIREVQQRVPGIKLVVIGMESDGPPLLEAHSSRRDGMPYERRISPRSRRCGSYSSKWRRSLFARVVCLSVPFCSPEKSDADLPRPHATRFNQSRAATRKTYFPRAD
jgi:hypothetical protein